MEAIQNETQKSDRGAEKAELNGLKELFVGWLNNHMTVILFALQDIRERDPVGLMKIRIFLQDLGHHFSTETHRAEFCEAADRLSCFFQKYPHVKESEAQAAFHLVRSLYGFLGIHLTLREICPKIRQRKERCILL